VSASQGWPAQFLLRYASPLAGLRRVPVLGQCLSSAGEKLVPRDSLAWVQVRNGPAKDLWPHLNPRTRILLEEFSRLGYACQPCRTNHILALPR
jgi:hypothetical protein